MVELTETHLQYVLFQTAYRFFVAHTGKPVYGHKFAHWHEEVDRCKAVEQIIFTSDPIALLNRLDLLLASH